jgi:hypothetical protein
VLDFIGEAIVEGVSHLVGRVVLPVISLGKVRAEGLTEVGPFPWHGFKRMPDGTIVASINATTGVGLVFLIGTIVSVAIVGYQVFCS